MSKTRIAVITDRNDAHLPFVQRHIETPLVVLDPRELVEQKGLTFQFKGSETIVRYGDDVLDDICGVWYRKPQEIAAKDLPVPQDYKAYSQNAMQRHASLLLTAFQDATWVSDYYAIVRANNKGLQLATAAKLGFNVPETVITSSTAQAQEFLAKHDESVTKPLTNAHPKVAGKQKILLTTLISKDFMPDLTNLYLAPSIFQEAIDVAHEIRVTVVGDQVFAAIVRSVGDVAGTPWAHVRDNRLGHYEGKVTIEAMTDFPEDIAELCVNHTKKLHLNYGAIDLILDKKGNYWFLENNPNGQWAYIEEATGQPIGKAVADLLSGA